MHEGTIKAIVLDRGFGFVEEIGGPDCFFHMSELVDLDFDERLIGRRVLFDHIDTARGPKAVGVRAAESWQATE